MKKIIFLMLAIFINSGIWAAAHSKGMFSISVENETLYGSAADTLVSALDKQFSETTFKKTLWYMADSQSMSTRGLGVTYSTNQSFFILSASGNAGVAPGSRSISQLIADPLATGASGIPETGAGVQGSILAGISLKQFHLKPIGFFDPSRLTIFANFFAFKLTTPLDISTFSIGAHVQYKIINEMNFLFGLFHWSGLDLTSGVDIANNIIALPVGLFFSNQTAGGLVFTPAGNVGFTNTAITIPVEVSTSVRLAYVLSLIVGAAVDINMGNSKLDIGGPITASATSAKVGDLTTTEKSRMGASFVDARLFFGPQINLIPLASGKNILSVTVLGNISTNNIFGVHASVNAGF